MKNNKISIPKPCDFGWENMTTLEGSNNRHCAACDKVIVDFTRMSNDEIKTYLMDRPNEKVCGHMTHYQPNGKISWVQRPAIALYNHVNDNMKSTKMAATLLLFLGFILSLSGCFATSDGEPAPEPQDTLSTHVHPDF